MICLQEQSANVREENAELRQHLLALMASNRALREREEILKKQSRVSQALPLSLSL